MKPTVATAISVAGVLAAGAAAFAVNSSVLGGSAPSDSVVAAATPLDTALGRDTGQVSAQDESLSVPNSTLAPAGTPISDTTTTYKVGDAGSVVIDTASGRITIASIMPAAGWAAEPASTQPDGSVKVHFYSTTTRLEFIAALTNGKVAVSVSTDTLGGSGGSGKPAERADGDDREDDKNHEDRRGDDDHESREGSDSEDDD